jgi:hypothetical protein
MWGYPEFYIPAPGGWNESITTIAAQRHDEYRQDVEPHPVIPEAEAEPEAA